MKDKFDKLVFIKDRDYHIVFQHFNIGDTTIAKKGAITKTTAINSNSKNEYDSLIDNIDSTFQCGICGSRDDPIGDNEIENEKEETKWIVCDGPREDDSNSILCNQWYHQYCINTKNIYDYNKFYNNDKLEIDFGYNCKHSEWFKNLNDETQDCVIKNISFIRKTNN